MYQVLGNGQVLLVDEIGNKTHYDMIRHVKLSSSKEIIAADDRDSTVITATVYDYLDNPLVGYNDQILFDIEGNDIVTNAVGGVAQIEITSDHDNEINIFAIVPQGRGAEVIIYATTS